MASLEHIHVLSWLDRLDVKKMFPLKEESGTRDDSPKMWERPFSTACRRIIFIERVVSLEFSTPEGCGQSVTV